MWSLSDLFKIAFSKHWQPRFLRMHTQFADQAIQQRYENAHEQRNDPHYNEIDR